MKKLAYRLALVILLLSIITTSCTPTDLTSEQANQDNKPAAPANPVSLSEDIDKNQDLSPTHEPTATNIPTKPATATPISNEPEKSDTESEVVQDPDTANDSIDDSLKTSDDSKDNQTPKRSTYVTASSAVSPPTFYRKTQYDNFPEEIQEEFSRALESEFGAASYKMGISAAVYKDGVLWSESLGLASEDTPLTPDMPLGIMSTSKTFLSALILKQISQGLYTLDSQVSDLLSQNKGYQSVNPEFMPDATVRDLLRMRSGIGTDTENQRATAMVLLAPTWEPSNMLKLIDKKPVPSGSYQYTSGDSVLLGLIAEESGRSPLHELYQEHLFAPLDIQAGLRPIIDIPPTMAKPYADKSRYGANTMFGDSLDSLGFGDLTTIKMYGATDFRSADGRLQWSTSGIVTTAENVAYWGYSLLSPNGSKTLADIREQLKGSIVDETIELAAGPQKYGYHLASRIHDLDNGVQVLTFGHPGGGGGYSSVLFYAPSLDLSVSLLANSELTFDNIGTCGKRGEHWINPLDCIARDFFRTIMAHDDVAF
ncbi:MAG: serine hydrolase [Chloroflexota bacterium]|nr:serine hydrolase [Chloroflexota bacterium]